MMAIFETFSKRKKRIEKAGQADVYQYEIISDSLRVQIGNILTEALGSVYDERGNTDVASGERWKYIHALLAHEYGVHELSKEGRTPYSKCIHFLENAPTERALDMIEIGFRLVEGLSKEGRSEWIKQKYSKAVSELNYRLREHAVGYQYESGTLVRVDSQFLHSEVVKPALALLHEADFKGASEEFLLAHDHYRANRNSDSIVSALKAFESTMKGICDARKWSYAPNITARGLIELLLAKGLVPQSVMSQFTALRSVLESGLPTIRNSSGGHGQGKVLAHIPNHLAAFALHLASSNIVYLIACHKSLK